MPVARLLAAFVAIKDRHKPMYASRTKRACPACGIVASPDRMKEWKALTAFGIPMYTWKRIVIETCRSCHAEIQRKKATFVQSALWFVS